jgi:acyl-[acyl-carrier-protein] desaturase
MEVQVRDFEMPGAGVEGFRDLAKAIARAGIYDLAIHHDQILVPVIMRHWRLESLEGLTPEAEQARERLVERIAKIERVGRRMSAKREEATAGANA